MSSSSSDNSTVEEIEVENVDEEELSGWDSIRNFFTSTVSSSSNSLNANAFVDDNIEDITNVLAVENVKLKLSTILKKRVKCPLCDFETRADSYNGKSVHSVLKIIKKHLLGHEREIEETKEKVCPLCSFTCSDKYMRKHYRMVHPDETVPDFSEIDSKKSHVLASLLQLIDERAKKASEVRVAVKNDRIHRSSHFKGFKTRINLTTFHKLMCKEFENTSKSSVFLQFKVTHSKKSPFSWVCGLCDRDTVGYLPCKFGNDLSLRLYALRHFTLYHPDNESIMKICDKEWKNLKEDTGLELERYNHWSSRYEQKNRTHWLYMEPYNEDSKDVITEMITRFWSDELQHITSDSNICLICMNVITSTRIGAHFTKDECHAQLLSHPEKSEFLEIEEIAEFDALNPEIYPMGIFRYSKMFCLQENDDTSSLSVYKWRCPLPSEENCHISDVLLFPRAELLQLYVLKHFQDFHGSFFSKGFLDFEWKLLSNKMKINLLEMEPVNESNNFEIDDPNDYQWPLAYKAFNRNKEQFKICYFCFWCGLPESFPDHIAMHGYLPTGKELSSNSDLYHIVHKKYKKSSYKPFEVEKVPKKVLGTGGKTFLNGLSREETSFMEVVDDEKPDSPNLLSSPPSSPSPPSPPSSLSDQMESNSMLQKLGTKRERSSFEESPSASQRSSLRCSARDATLKISQSLDESLWKTAIQDSDSSSSSDDESSISHLSMIHVVDTEDTALESIDEQLGDEISIDLDRTLTKPSDSSPKDEEDIDDSILGNLEEVNNDRSFMDVELTFHNASAPPSLSMSNSNTSCSEPRDAAYDEQISTEKLNLIKKKFEKPIMKTLPPMNFAELNALELMKIRRCFLCKGNPLIKVANDSCLVNGQTENYVLSHLILNHPENEVVRILIERKRTMLLSKEPFNPTPFLLEFTGHLTCSACSKVEQNRCSALMSHFVSCMKNNNRQASEKKTKEQVTKMNKTGSVMCPLKQCGLRIRTGLCYDSSFTKIIHLLCRHSEEKEAYELGMKMKEELNLAESLPFLDVTKSFSFTIEKNYLTLVCAKCEKCFHRAQELLTHYSRYHCIKPLCPYGCADEKVSRNRRIPIKCYDVKLAYHILRCHYKMEDVLNHFDERVQKLCSEEQYYRVDLKKSAQESVKLGRLIYICLECENETCSSKFMAHARICFRLTNILSLRKSNGDNDMNSSTASRSSSLPRVHCKFCRKSFLACYNEEATLFHHSLKHHRENNLVKEWVSSLNIDEMQEKIPVLDVRKALEVFNKGDASKGCYILFCSLCSKSFATLSHLVVHHAVYCSKILLNTNEKDDKALRYCSFCKKHIKKAVTYSDLVNIAGHLIDRHASEVDETYMSAEQKITLGMSVPFLDFDESVSQKKLVCSICKQSNASLRNLLSHAFVVHNHECSKAGVHRGSTSPSLPKPSNAGNISVLAQSTPKRTTRSSLCLETDFGASESPITSFTSDKSKWADAFNRYGKIQVELREKSMLAAGTTKEGKQMTMSSFMKKLTTDAESGDKNKEVVAEDTNDIINTRSSKSTESWLQMDNMQSVVTPKTPALRLRSALGSTTETQSSDNLADALASIFEPKTPNVSFGNDSILSLLPANAVSDFSMSDLPPNDLSHIPGCNGFKCKKCSYVGLKASDVMKHMKLSHHDGSNSGRPMKREIISQCIICQRCFSNREKLHVHIKAVHKDVPKAYPCSYCGKGYCTILRVREHERRIHEDVFKLGADSLKCSHCSLVFLTVRNKRLHEKRHTMPDS